MENNTQNQEVISQKPKIYDPGWYGFLIFIALIAALIFSGGIFFCLIPVFIMSLHNAKIVPNGEAIGKRMKTYLWIYIGYFVASIVLFGWAYLVIVKWLIKQPEFIAGALTGGSDMFFNMLKPAFSVASAEGGALGIASAIFQYSSYILWIPILILILLVYSYTRKNELPVFKELRASQQVDRKSPLVPIFLSIAIAIVFVAGVTFSINPITQFFLKGSLNTEITSETRGKTPKLPSLPTDVGKKTETQEMATGNPEPKNDVDIKREQVRKANLDYKIVGAFTEGLFIIMDKENNWFYADETGRRINDINYKEISLFKEGKAAIKDLEGNAYHIYPDGTRVYPENYYSVKNYSDGYAVVALNYGTYFHIDAKGKRIYEQAYKKAGDFHEGFAAVESNETSMDKLNYAWNYVDNNGKLLCEKGIMDAREFVSGRAAVRNYVEGQGTQSYHIDTNCMRAYPESYPYLGDYFSSGVAPVGDSSYSSGVINNQLFLIDINGKRITTDVFSDIRECTSNSIIVQDKEGNYYHIGIDGKKLYDQKYKRIYFCDENGIAKAEDENGESFYIDSKGNRI